MKSGSRHKPLKLSTYISLTLGMFLVFVASFVVYILQASEANRANNFRQQSFLLADELRQSSNDLTRMVRSYIVTDDEKYKHNYQTILGIRDGIIPRPVDYQYIYWDLLLQGELTQSPQGEAISLLTLMSLAGFTEDEFARLATSKASSDSLTKREFAAINLIESTSPPTEANRVQAINMLYDSSYHQAKADIMEPIQQVFEMAGQRTLNIVNAAENRATIALLAVCLFGASMMYLLWLTQRNMKTVLGGSISDIYAELSRLGRGRFSTVTPVPKGMEDSVIGWVAKTQSKLNQLDAENKQAEEELHRMQKIESLGQLSAGIAHEINTPLQFVSDNISYVSDAIASIDPILQEVRNLLEKVESSETQLQASDFERLQKRYESADVDFLLAESSLAVAQSKAGMGRITRIVMSMKEFSHPGKERVAVDLNEIISNTLIVASSELKDIAELVTDFDKDLPLVFCIPSAISQVILNIVVNAAHAIADAGENWGMNKITVSTAVDDDQVIIKIADSGPGMPEDVRNKIFDPFFTTKRVGKGTGQGLSIAHKIICEQHNGNLSVDSKLGEGCCFTIRLPTSATAKS